MEVPLQALKHLRTISYRWTQDCILNHHLPTSGLLCYYITICTGSFPNPSSTCFSIHFKTCLVYSQNVPSSHQTLDAALSSFLSISDPRPDPRLRPQSKTPKSHGRRSSWRWSKSHSSAASPPTQPGWRGHSPPNPRSGPPGLHLFDMREPLSRDLDV